MPSAIYRAWYPLHAIHVTYLSEARAFCMRSRVDTLVQSPARFQCLYAKCFV